MAMRLAVILESHATSCADFIQSNSNAEQPPDDEFPSWDTGLPELPSYPDDADGWRAIDRKLAGRCLSLRNKLAASQSVIEAVIKYTMDELGDTLDEHAAKRGLEAWHLAVALRDEHDVEEVDTEWDYVDGLHSALQKVEKARRRRQEEGAEVWRSIEAHSSPAKPDAP